MEREYKPDELKKLHAVQIEILSEVIRVCKENGINYFTVGGTTLGAVRHNGFIPWDDDIDIGMLRPDYDRFIEIAPQKLRKGYTLQHFTTDKNVATYFAKVRKDNTLFVEGYMAHLKMHHGIYIDIMPHDYVPEDEKERKRYNMTARICQQLFSSKSLWMTMAQVQNKTSWLITTFVRCCLHIMLLPVSKAFLFKMTDKVLKRYDKTDSTMTSSRGYPCFECDVADLLPVVQHEFETITVDLPGNTHKVLEQQYGDYMKLPPVHKRINHAPIQLKFYE